MTKFYRNDSFYAFQFVPNLIDLSMSLEEAESILESQINEELFGNAIFAAKLMKKTINDGSSAFTLSVTQLENKYGRAPRHYRSFEMCAGDWIAESELKDEEYCLMSDYDFRRIVVVGARELSNASENANSANSFEFTKRAPWNWIDDELLKSFPNINIIECKVNHLVFAGVSTSAGRVLTIRTGSDRNSPHSSETFLWTLREGDKLVANPLTSGGYQVLRCVKQQETLSFRS